MIVKEYGREHGETMILLHGGGLSWWNYRDEAELLGRSFHVVLPVLDGHNGADADFAGIEENAGRIIAWIDRECGGKVLLIGGLSLGGQITAEILSHKKDICRYAVIESASVIPDRMTAALIGPAFSASYGLVRNRKFAEIQFRYLRIRENLFEEYYRDSAGISLKNLSAFTKESALYRIRDSLSECDVRTLIIAGGKERKTMIRSAEKLHAVLKNSSLIIKEGLFHGEFSLNHPAEYTEEVLKLIQNG